MAAERRLATFVHISDLHIGDLDQNRDSQVQDWYYRRIYRGYLGHHSAALDHLDEFFGETLENEPDSRLLVVRCTV
jgi:hypothetical protein